MNHQNIGKICSIAIVLALLLAAVPFAVKAQQAYPPGDWKFRIVDDWGKWGGDVPSQANPVSDQFGAVAFLYNSTKPRTYTGDWGFEKWVLLGVGEADKDGWVTISGLPGNVWDSNGGQDDITYTLIVKLKIGKTLTPITIFNATVLRIGDSGETPQAVGLYDLLNATAIHGVYQRGSIVKNWIKADKQADGTETVGGKLYAKYKMWLYYVAMQLLDENGFPITGAQLRVLFDSSYLGKTYIKNTPVEGWRNKLYGIWVTNGTMGSEFIPDTDVDGDGTIYDPNLKVGWVLLRVPRISPSTGADSSLVNKMTFVWLYKTNTTIAVNTYTDLDYQTYTTPPPPWGDDSPNDDALTANAIHEIEAQVRWTWIRLLDCNENNWWTMKAEVTGFDAMYKDQYQLMATRVAPGTYLLRYPVPVAMQLINYDFETGKQGWYASTEHYGPDGGDTSVEQSTAQAHSGSASLVVHWTDPSQSAKPHVDFDSPIDLRGKTITVWVWVPVSGLWAEIYAQGPNYSGWYSSGGVGIDANQWVQLTWTVPNDAPAFQRLGVQVGGNPGQAIDFYIDDFDWPEPSETEIKLSVEWYYSVVNMSSFTVGSEVDELAGTLDDPVTLKCNMSWVDVSFWSETELPQQPADFAAKIWLPATIGYRKAEPLTVWWNGRNGFVVLPDMEWYAGPNPARLDDLDPYSIVTDEGFIDFYTQMIQSSQYGYGFGGNGWLPTREVGWVDFEAWYEGVKVLDTYAEGKSLKIPCCPSTPPFSTTCHYNNLTLKIYEIGFHIILEACGEKMDAPSGVPFFFKHPSPDISSYGMIGPKAVHEGKVDIVKAPYGNYSGFAIVWQMSLLRPYKIMYLFDNGTSKEITEPILLDKNMRNIQLYFKLWNLTVRPVSQDPFTLVNVKVRAYSKSEFGIAPGVGISKRQLDIITDSSSMYCKYVLPSGWEVYARGTDEYGFPLLYYMTDVKTVYWDPAHGKIQLPFWDYLPEKEYWIRVFVPENAEDAQKAGFRRVDANATLYWSGDPWNKPIYLDRCYTWSAPLVVKTYVYDPKIALKTACGEPLVFDEEDQSALIVAEPWYSDVEPYNLFYRQQIDPEALVMIGTPGGVMDAPYNAYLIRKNSTDAKGIVELHSVNATHVAPPEDPDLWNPTTGREARKYPEQSRYFIGYSPGTPPTVLESKPTYRIMVYYKGVLVFNSSIALSNPYVSKEHVLITSVYPYVFMPVNTPFEGEQPRFGIPGVKVKVFWAGLNITWWPTKQLVYETAPIEFSLLNASKLEKGFNMSVVKRLWGPKPAMAVPIDSIPFTPIAPYLSSLVWEEEGVTNAEGKATFLIPVWNYSVTPNIYTWMESDGSTNVNLEKVNGGPRNPWNIALGPLSINLLTAGATGRMPYIFGTPVYAEFWTVPGTTVNIPANDVPRLLSPLEDGKYCRWIQYAMNATGLVNPATKVWKDTGCVSLNTTYRAEYRSTTCMGVAVGGVGMLGGGAYQGRTPDRETGTTVTQGQDGCYAKVEERVPANDLYIVVRNIDKIGLPNQRVTVIRENVYKYVKDGNEYASWVEGGSKELVEAAKVWLVQWTPTVINAPEPDYYRLELRSTQSLVLWGIYNVTVRTENLTSEMSNVKLRLNDPQFLVKRLLGTDIDWSSGTVYLDWPARLRITILTEDGRPLDKAWVYIIDAYSRGNVTAAITDDYGHAGTLYVGEGKAAPALVIEPGDRVDIGFNLLRGWYWLNESRMLSGEPVNPDWDIGEDPKQPIGMAYVQELVPGRWARFYGKYYVVVYYKPGGCDAVLGPVWSEVVFDSYNDEAHHQFIYLGILPEAVAAVSDYSASQAPKYRAYVRDLKISFRDSVGRELTGVEVVAKRPEYTWTINLGRVETGTAVLSKVPLRPGTSYAIDAKWTSRYGGKQAEVKNYPVKELESVVVMPVYDVALRLVTRKGTPLAGVEVKVEGEPVGATTGLTGEVLVTQIPAGTYSVSARWLDTDLALPSLKVTASGIVTLTPTNVYTLTVRVLGAQGQAIEGATVRVTKGAVELTRLTDKDGKAEIELPGASYNVEVTYGNFRATESVTLTTDTVKTVNLDVFIELFGVGMTMAQFLLLIVMIIIIVIVLAVVVHEYHIYRRKRLPQLFGAPAAPK
ncbi:MAG: carboxypeptidase-like regulatory domain-containing protein [Candidatus Bathyarchaeia archaeon]